MHTIPSSLHIVVLNRYVIIIASIFMGGNPMKENFDAKAIENIKEKIQSPVGQQLLSMLQGMDPQTLSAALQHASNGDYSKVSQTLAPLLASEDLQKLLRQMEG